MCRMPAARRGRPQSAARPLARHRLQARGAVQHRRLRRRLRRPVPAGAVAVRAFRSLAVGGRRVFLLVEHAERLLLSGRGLDREARGLVNTMVFTHIPSSMFLILAAFSPNLYLALGLLLLRSALSQMDVPTRTSYVMAVVTPAERPAAASVTAVPRSLASAISPAISGALLMTAFPACRWWSAARSRSPTISRCCTRSATSSRRRSGGARDQPVRRSSGRASIDRRSSRWCDHSFSFTSGVRAVAAFSKRKAIFWLAWTWYLAACASQYHFFLVR